jgi:hypothetical protein
MSRQPTLSFWATDDPELDGQLAVSMSRVPTFGTWCDEWLPSWPDNQADLLGRQLNLQGEESR